MMGWSGRKGRRVNRDARGALLAFWLLGLPACGGPPTHQFVPTAPLPTALSADTTAAPSAQLNVVIDKYGSTVAIAGVSSVAFDLTGSTGTGLTYEVNFGDALASSQPVSQHVYASRAYQDFKV